MLENEVWKTYQEFPWIQVSTFGRVRTLDRVVHCGKGTRIVKGHILKQWCTKKGYLFVAFRVNGKLIDKRVHRLVAETFIPNPDNLPQVNHKDNNPANNCANNLEWCTGEYNIEYREKHGKALRHPVFAVNLKTLEVLRFPSQSEAGRQLGTDIGSLNSVIKCRLRQTGGYWFTNADDNAVEVTRDKFNDSMADKVAELLNGR